jgi:hypothetical protein
MSNFLIGIHLPIFKAYFEHLGPMRSHNLESENSLNENHGGTSHLLPNHSQDSTHMFIMYKLMFCFP